MTLYVPNATILLRPAPIPTRTLADQVLGFFRGISAAFESVLDEGCPDDIADCKGSECSECASYRAIK